MTLNPDFPFFMFQAIFDRRQNLTFDIGAFLKNPNLLVIPKSRCTVKFTTVKSKGKNYGRKKLNGKGLNFDIFDWWDTSEEGVKRRIIQRFFVRNNILHNIIFQFLLTKVLLSSWRPFGNWSHKNTLRQTSKIIF